MPCCTSVSALSYSHQKPDSWFHKYKLICWLFSVSPWLQKFSAPYNSGCGGFLCFSFCFSKKKWRSRRNGETLTTCLYLQIRLNWIGNKWPLKHCFHLLVLHLMTDNFLIFILKQAQWHWRSLLCIKERQSQEFALSDCQTDFSRLAICMHTLILFGNSWGLSYAKQGDNTKAKNY